MGMASFRRCRRKFRVLVDGSGAETADYFGIKKGEFVGEASEEGGKRGWSGIIGDREGMKDGGNCRKFTGETIATDWVANGWIWCSRWEEKKIFATRA
jgi:hypothetical protein